MLDQGQQCHAELVGCPQGNWYVPDKVSVVSVSDAPADEKIIGHFLSFSLHFLTQAMKAPPGCFGYSLALLMIKSLNLGAQ